MRSITITGRLGSVTLLKDLVFTITPQPVGETATMASGRTVRDHVGEKIGLNIPTGWLSPEDLLLLCTMISQEQVLHVQYPDVYGDRDGEFWFDPPTRKAFSYDADGVKQWYGVTLTATQYGVTTV